MLLQVTEAQLRTRGLVPTALLQVSPAELTLLRGIVFRRDEDDLGPMLVALLRLSSGREIGLTGRPGLESDETDVLVDVDERDPAGAVAELERELGLTLDATTPSGLVLLSLRRELVLPTPARGLAHFLEDALGDRGDAVVAKYLVSLALDARPAGRRGIDLQTSDGVTIVVRSVHRAAPAELLEKAAALLYARPMCVVSFTQKTAEPELAPDAWEFFVAAGPTSRSRRGPLRWWELPGAVHGVVDPTGPRG